MYSSRPRRAEEFPLGAIIAPPPRAGRRALCATAHAEAQQGSKTIPPTSAHSDVDKPAARRRLASLAGIASVRRTPQSADQTGYDFHRVVWQARCEDFGQDEHASCSQHPARRRRTPRESGMKGRLGADESLDHAGRHGQVRSVGDRQCIRLVRPGRYAAGVD